MTARNAAKLIRCKLTELGHKGFTVKAKTVSFMDLGRGSRVFVTVAGMSCFPDRGVLMDYARAQGFNVEFRN